MVMVPKQAEFAADIADLIHYAVNNGYEVTFGEAQRTIEQQEIYVRDGRSKTMRSNHMARLAIDLNFFWREKDGSLIYVCNKKELQSIGDYWEAKRPENKWGGNWKSFKDVPHFQRSRTNAV